MKKTFFSLRRNRAALRGLVRRLRRNKRGMAAVEFAYVFPVMLAVFLGMSDVATGVMMDRKVSMLNRTLADLTSQMAVVDNGTRDAIFSAAQAVLAPFDNRPTGMSFTSIVIDGAGIARACWVETRGMAAPFAAGAVVPLPADMRVPRTSFVMAQSNVTYQPAIGYVLTGSFALGSRPIYMRPRQATVGGPNNIEQVERSGRALC